MHITILMIHFIAHLLKLTEYTEQYTESTEVRERKGILFLDNESKISFAAPIDYAACNCLVGRCILCTFLFALQACHSTAKNCVISNGKLA